VDEGAQWSTRHSVKRCPRSSSLMCTASRHIYPI
jgi:hypothetical protein